MALIFLKLFDGVEVRLAKFCRPYGFFKGLNLCTQTLGYHKVSSWHAASLGFIITNTWKPSMNYEEKKKKKPQMIIPFSISTTLYSCHQALRQVAQL